MRYSNIRIAVIIVSLALFSSCQGEKSSYSPSRRHVIEASLRESMTRTILEEKDASFDLMTKWQGHEHIKVFYRELDTYNGVVPLIKVSEVTANGIGATFVYDVPREWGNTNSYEVKIFTTPCQPVVVDEKLYFNASIIREPLSAFQVPVYSEGEIDGGGKLSATFHHYYTYELLHVTNTSESDMVFSLLGFNGTPWFKDKGSLCLDDGSFVIDAPSTKLPKRESDPITIKPGESQVIVSAYIPNGGMIYQAQLVASINGETVYSSNTKTSGIELKQGHAYHMYVGWDGEDLTFWKDGVVPLAVKTLSASIDPSSLSGSFTAAVTNHSIKGLRTGFSIWKVDDPENYVEYDAVPGDNDTFSLFLTYDDFVYIACDTPVKGSYQVSAYVFDEQGNRYHGKPLDFTIDKERPDVQVIPVESVSLDTGSLILPVEGTSQLVAVVLPETATNKSVVWSSSDLSVATVSSEGLVTGVAAGTAVISVTTIDGGKTATCSVTVQEKVVPVTGISLDATSLALFVGDTRTLIATVSPPDATDSSVTWSSSDPSVATVSLSGVVTARKAGSAVIAATTVDGGKTATCQVTVKVPTTGGDIEGTEEDPWN